MEVMVIPLLKEANFGSYGASQLQPSFEPSIPGQGVTAKLQEFLVLDPFQSSFHTGHWTEMALVTLTYDLHRQAGVKVGWCSSSY